MSFNLSDKLIASGKLRLPVLMALAIAFTALWLIFTFILNYRATAERQNEVAILVEQVDDQIYQLSEDLRYQLLSSATLLATRDQTKLAIQTSNNNKLQEHIKQFHRTYSSQALIEQVQIFSETSELLASFGISSTNFDPTSTTLLETTDSATGIRLNQDGSIDIYAVVSIMFNNKSIGYVQVSKPYIDTIQDVSTLNKTNLYLMVDKSQISMEAVSSQYRQLGLINHWDIFSKLVLASPIQGNINLPSLATIVNDVVASNPNDAKYLQDQVAFGDQVFNLALFPINDIEGNYIGRILLLKDISNAARSYQVSFWITSVSFGVIMSLIFISFWYFLGRIENNISTAELNIIRAKNDAEKARDEAEHAKKIAIEANKIKSDFLAKMSHELRTPLNAIIGITEMMFEDATDYKDETYIEPLERVLRSSKHLLALINDILDLSKIEAGKMDLHPEIFDLTYFVNDVKRTCESLAVKHNNTLIVSIEPNIEDIFSDVTKLRQILLNLISNACKFTEDGEIILSLTQLKYEGVKHIRFSIKDNGIGMDPTQVDKLFNDFQQVDSSVTRKYEGTGLGLSISRKLAKLMGGNITVKSELNKGTEFIVSLPVNFQYDASEETPNTTIETPHSEPLNATENRKKLLLIDDDLDMVELLSYYLSGLNIDVSSEKNYSQALKKAQLTEPNLILINTLSEQQNSRDVLQNLTSNLKFKNATYIVVCDERHKQSYQNQGAKHCLIKPINKANVTEIFSNYV